MGDITNEGDAAAARVISEETPTAAERMAGALPNPAHDQKVYDQRRVNITNPIKVNASVMGV